MKAWIARDKDDVLYLFTEIPKKYKLMWHLPGLGNGIAMIPENTDEFNNVKWEDDEPTEIEIKIKN